MRVVTIAVISGALGGGVVAGALVGVGAVGPTQTVSVVAQAPIEASDRTEGLTPAQIYRRAAPGVVLVRAQIVRPTQSAFDVFPTEEQGESTGSGFVVDRGGDILTNAHVIDGAVKVTVQLEGDRTVDAKIVGRDASSDLALLRVNGDGLDLRPLALGSSREVQVGDPTVAIGNPFGLNRTLTTGVVSALQRQIQAPNGFTIDNVIQTDAPINPGNSGGPLLDAAGRVIGVNSQIETGDGTSGGSVGIGFAVPIDTARRVLPALEHGQPVRHPWLGVQTLTVDGSLAGLHLQASSGALVESVQRGSPADRAGIRGGDVSAEVQGEQVLLGGDIILGADGRPIRGSDDLATALAGKRPGDSITLRIRSADGRTRQVVLVLGSRPDAVPSGLRQG